MQSPLQVTVVERRSRFTRHNILHLWDWVCSDLIRLGANGAEILGKSFFHVGTRNLQVHKPEHVHNVMQNDAPHCRKRLGTLRTPPRH